MAKKVTADDLQTCTAENICVIKPSAFGDVVQCLTLLPVLRRRFPNAKITWVINRELTGILEGHPDLDELIPFERRGNLKDWRSLLRKLRKGNFDLVFDLQGLLRSGFMTMTTAAPLRVGLETAREGAHLACNITLPDTDKSVPAFARNWRVAEALGLGDLTPETIINIPDEDRQWAREQLAELKRPILAVHPGARWVTKLWPVESFAVVCTRAVRQWECSVLLLGGSGERKRCEELEKIIHRLHPGAQVLNLAGGTTIKQLCALTHEIRWMLTNDSGPMHLAAGLGKQVIGVFTCTSPVRSGPPGAHHALVATDVPCAASYFKKCPNHGQEFMCCMEDLSSEKVWQAFESLVNRDQNVLGATA
ncbi:MAG: glycosyltransferase family 9 protein [Planctomycetales bacterium]